MTAPSAHLGDSTHTDRRRESKPELRHEFVAMMFAVTIGEVGVRVAPLIREGHYLHYLPAYSHLVLATCLIAASFVGWAHSPSPGGRRDVRKVLEWEFLVLLVDVLLVICYFILVQAVDFQKGEGGGKTEYHPRAEPEAFGIALIFTIYLVWDVITKIVQYSKKDDGPWPNLAARIVATLLCFVCAWIAYFLIRNADPPHVVVADLALLGLVLLFRAFKDFASAFFRAPSRAGDPEPTEKEIRAAKRNASLFSAIFLVWFIIFLLWTWNEWRLPQSWVTEITTPIPSEVHQAERAASSPQELVPKHLSPNP